VGSHQASIFSGKAVFPVLKMSSKSLMSSAATSQPRPLGLITALALTWPPSKVAIMAVTERLMDFMLMVPLAKRIREEWQKYDESERLLSFKCACNDGYFNIALSVSIYPLFSMAIQPRSSEYFAWK
jgi:hypothetical protein